MIPQCPNTSRAGTSALVVGLVLAVTLAACGGAAGTDDGGVVSLASPSASPDGSASPATSMDPEEAILAFNACMKEHGVDVQVSISTEGGGIVGGGPRVNSSGPDEAREPQAGTGDFDPKKLEAADKACRSLLPNAGRLGDPSATIPPEQVEAMLGFAKCMREHGVDFPDPQFSGGGMTVQIGGGAKGDSGGIDPSSEKFQAAQEACAAEMPDGAPFVVGGPATQVKP